MLNAFSLEPGWLSIVTRLWAGRPGLHSRHRDQVDFGAHPVSYSMGTGDPFLGLKRPGRETDHSSPTGADVKNVWSYTSFHQHPFMAYCSIKAQGQLYLYLLL